MHWILQKGALRWSFDITHRIGASSPVILDGAVFIGIMGSSFLYAIE